MPDLNLASRPLPNACFYIEAQGFLDAHTYEQMDKLIETVFSRGCHRIILNLERIDYISSAGVGVFAGNLATAQAGGGNLVFMNPSTNVREVFDLLGFSQLFQFANSIEQAMAYFR
jgi:anti-sigma B factor antagonist